jgi:xylulokinase
MMSNSSVICGVDIGSTNVKVLLMDAQGQTLWAHSIPVPRVPLADGPVTDATALVSVLERMIVAGWHAIGGDRPIGAISTTGVGEDGLPLDAKLQPLDVAIPWFDRRAEGQAKELQILFDQPSLAGVAVDGTRTAAKWLWLRQHRPEVMTAAATWIALTDYPAVCWSNQPFMSKTLAARTACYDVFHQRWIDSHLIASKAPKLPQVLEAGTVVGTVTSRTLIESGAVSASTMVVVGGHDHPIAASVVHRVDPTAIVDSLGTANLIYGEAQIVFPRVDPYVAFSVPARGGVGVACLGVYEFSAALDSHRFKDGGLSLRATLASESIPGDPSNETQILDCLKRSLGILSSNSTRVGAGDVRAQLEAGCFYARRMLESARAAGIESKTVFSVGGWARSKALLRLRASVFGQPISTLDEQELTALGAALIARDAAFPSTAEQLQRSSQVIDPDTAWTAQYAQMYPDIRANLRSWLESEQ